MSAASNARGGDEPTEAPAPAPASAAPASEEEVISAAAAPANDGVSGADMVDHRNRQERMRDLFASQPKVRIKLPIDESRGARQLVSINGYAFTIERGVKVDVPQGVADFLEEIGLI